MLELNQPSEKMLPLIFLITDNTFIINLSTDQNLNDWHGNRHFRLCLRKKKKKTCLIQPGDSELPLKPANFPSDTVTNTWCTLPFCWVKPTCCEALRVGGTQWSKKKKENVIKIKKSFASVQICLDFYTTAHVPHLPGNLAASRFL